MKNTSIALVTASVARDLDEDLPPLENALRASGANLQTVNWDDPAMDWSQFDVALVRSTWDYTLRLTEFLAWAQRASQATELLNPLPMIRWNTDKHYLAELAAAGVPVVPSVFIEPGEEASTALADFLHAHAAAEFVVKPAIGAGSRDAQRYGRDELANALVHVQRLLDANRSVLLQPYLDRVDKHGETALISSMANSAMASAKARCCAVAKGRRARCSPPSTLRHARHLPRKCASPNARWRRSRSRLRCCTPASTCCMPIWAAMPKARRACWNWN